MIKMDRDGQGTQAPQGSGVEPTLGQGTSCKAPQRTCNYRLVLCAQDEGIATKGHKPPCSQVKSPHGRPYPEFRQPKQVAKGSLAGATQTKSSLQEGKEPQPIPEPQKNTAGTSHSSPLPAPRNLFNQPRPPRAHSQATRCQNGVGLVEVHSEKRLGGGKVLETEAI